MSKNISKRKNCIFVGGLPIEATEKVVRGYFEQFGEVKGVVLNKQKLDLKDCDSKSLQQEVDFGLFTSGHNTHRGCGFVEFSNSQVVKSVTHSRDHYIYGHKIDCRVAMTNNERKGYQKSIMNERRKVFIGKLPHGVDKAVVTSYFSRLGEIEDVTLIYKAEKSFGICFILFKQHFIGDKLINRQFEILPGVFVECELALNPQQLHQRKLQEQATLENSSDNLAPEFIENSESSNVEYCNTYYNNQAVQGDPLSTLKTVKNTGPRQDHSMKERPSKLELDHSLHDKSSSAGPKRPLLSLCSTQLEEKGLGRYLTTPRGDSYLKSEFARPQSDVSHQVGSGHGSLVGSSSSSRSLAQDVAGSVRGALLAAQPSRGLPERANQPDLMKGQLSRLHFHNTADTTLSPGSAKTLNVYILHRGELLENRPKYFRLFA